MIQNLGLREVAGAANPLLSGFWLEQERIERGAGNGRRSKTVGKIGRVRSELFERDVYSCQGEAERRSTQQTLQERKKKTM